MSLPPMPIKAEIADERRFIPRVWSEWFKQLYELALAGGGGGGGGSAGPLIASKACMSTTTAVAAFDAIPFDTSKFDVGGSIVAGVFTSPVSAPVSYYLITGMLQVSVATDILLYKNGVLEEYLGYVHFANENAPYSSMVEMDPSDTIDVRLGTSGNVNGISGTPVSYMNVARVAGEVP